MSHHVQDLKRDATPGTPYSLLGGNNGQLIDSFYNELVELTVRRLLCLQRASFRTAPIQAVEADLCDPIRVFVKQEPHKLEKIKTRRLRLIWVLSVIDQLVERVLYSDQTKIEIEHWKSSPTKPGMGATDEDFEALYEFMTQLLSPHSAPSGLSNTDVKGWDCSVKRWMQVADYVTRLRHWAVPLDSDLARIAYVVTELRCQPIISLSDGQLFVKTRPGMQISGRLITSNGNSRMRVLLASLRFAPCMAMGDDCVESSLGERTSSFYTSLGLSVEESLHDSVLGIVFCSHEYIGPRAAFLRTASRTIFRFFSRKSYMVDYVQLEEELRHFPQPARGTALEACLEYALANEQSRLAEEGRHVSSYQDGLQGGNQEGQEGKAPAADPATDPAGASH